MGAVLPGRTPPIPPAFTLLIPAGLGPQWGQLRATRNPGPSRWAAESAGGRRSFWTISLPSRSSESQTAWRCALSGARMLAADGYVSGWDNPAYYFFCAVCVPRRSGGVTAAMVRRGQLTDVRVARFTTRICRIEGVVVAHIYPCIGIPTHALPPCRRSPWSLFHHSGRKSDRRFSTDPRWAGPCRRRRTDGPALRARGSRDRPLRVRIRILMVTFPAALGLLYPSDPWDAAPGLTLISFPFGRTAGALHDKCLRFHRRCVPEQVPARRGSRSQRPYGR